MRITSIPLEDDTTDRLHHYLTSIFLFISLLISSKRQYIGSPISCWCPKTFTNAHVEYAENFCWTENTYHIPPENDIPVSIIDRKLSQLIYYQWVPCLLLVQIIFFQIPNCLWIAWYPTTGLNVRAIIETATKAANLDASIRKKVVRQIGCHLRECLAIRTRLFGSSLCIFYLFIKVLYLVNVLAQILLLISFLGGGISKKSIFPDFNANYGNNSYSLFPHATLCDITVRQLGNLHRYTIQCVLPINRVNEKIYLSMRLWFFILTMLTILSVFRWTTRLLFVSARVGHVAQLVESEEESEPNPETYSLLVKFTEEALHHDGVLMLLLLGHNAGKLVASEIATWLWLHYKADMERPAIQVGEFTSTIGSTCPSENKIENRRSNLSILEEKQKDVVVPCHFLFS